MTRRVCTDWAGPGEAPGGVRLPQRPPAVHVPPPLTGAVRVGNTSPRTSPGPQSGRTGEQLTRAGPKARARAAQGWGRGAETKAEAGLNKTEDDATSECRQALELRVRDDFPYLKYVIEDLDALKREQIKL